MNTLKALNCTFKWVNVNYILSSYQKHKIGRDYTQGNLGEFRHIMKQQSEGKYLCAEMGRSHPSFAVKPHEAHLRLGAHECPWRCHWQSCSATACVTFSWRMFTFYRYLPST